MRIIVTGGCGFIGSHLIDMLLNCPELELLWNFDIQTYAGQQGNLDHINDKRFTNIREDIRDATIFKSVLKSYDIDYVFNLAACSHVDNSITGPEEFYSTNIIGTTKLLESIREVWKPGDNKAYIQVSTDERYGSLPLTGNLKFTEDSKIDPRSPYSASKAAADGIVLAYYHTYGLPTIVTSCSNNFGIRQHREKFIPNCIYSLLEGKKIPIYGKGINERDWLHVYDHCNGLIKAATLGIPGEVYNFGTGKSIRNINVADKIISSMKRIKPDLKCELEYVNDRPGHDLRYTIDYSKSKDRLGWEPNPAYSLDLYMDIMVKWYINKYEEEH